MTLLHHPYGVEHPYASSPDQRTPVLPDAGDRVRLGVVVDGPAVGPVRCEWQDPTGVVEVLDLAPAGPSADSAALAGGEGHLAEAQAAQLGSDGGWAVTTGALAAGRHRYRFLASDEVTDWFDVAVATWEPDGGRLTVGGSAEHPRLVPDSVRWLRNEDGVHRVRFALRLDARRARGRLRGAFRRARPARPLVDAVVFDQYKGQGGRPHVHADAVRERRRRRGLGFHVDTGRASASTSAASEPDRSSSRSTSSGEVRASSTRASSRATRRACSRRSSTRPAGPGRPSGSTGSGPRATSGTPRRASLAEVTHRDRGDPGRRRRDRGMVGRGDLRRVQWRARRGPSGRLAASPGRLHFPGRRAVARPEGWVVDMHARGVKVLLWQIPLVKADERRSRRHRGRPDQTGQARADRRRWCARPLVRQADGPPTATGLVVPPRPPAGLHERGPRRWWVEKRRYCRGGRRRRLQDRRGRARVGPRARYADGSRGGETNNRYPVLYGQAYHDLLRSRRTEPVTFSRAGFTGSRRASCGRATRTRPGRHSAPRSRPGSPPARPGSSSGAGTSPASPGRCPSRSSTCGGRRGLLLPVMQLHSEFNHHRAPSRDRTPWNVAERTDDRRDPRLPPLRPAARAARPLPRRAGPSARSRPESR